MRLFNVEIIQRTTAVVVADDADEAHQVAIANARSAFRDDCGCEPRAVVTGEVLSAAHLKDGWDVACVPYGGDGDTRISALLTIKDQGAPNG